MAGGEQAHDDHLHLEGDDPTSPSTEYAMAVARDQAREAREVTGLKSNSGPVGGMSVSTTSWVDNLKLGAIPAPSDPRTLRLEDFLLPALAPPATFSNSSVVNPWGMLNNDVEGCCVVSGIGHADMLWSLLAGTPHRVTDAEVHNLYRQLTGGPDNGLVILNAIKAIKQTGFSGRPLLGYAHVDPRNTVLIKTAIAMFGGVLRGILLPNTAKSQTGRERWAVVDNGPDGTPGSWGGHLTLDTGYDVVNLETITWGQVQRVQPEFYVRYSMEAWVLIPTYPVPGFDQAKFVQALKDLGTQVNFDPVPTPPPSPVPAFDITSVPWGDLEKEFYRRTGGWGDLDISLGFKNPGFNPWTGAYRAR